MNLSIAEMPTPFCFRPETPMTDDELLRLSERNEILWIERDASGWIHVKPIGGTRTGLVSAKIAAALGRWADQDGRGEALANAGFVPPDGSMFGARAAWILKERWQPRTDAERDGFTPHCPDFLIEILARPNEREELEAKMELWIANGFALAWLIDPERKVARIYRPGDTPEVLHEPSSVQGSGPVAGFELLMARVWQ